MLSTLHEAKTGQSHCLQDFLQIESASPKSLTNDAPDCAAREGGGGPCSEIKSVRCCSSLAMPYVPPVICKSKTSVADSPFP